MKRVSCSFVFLIPFFPKLFPLNNFHPFLPYSFHSCRMAALFFPSACSVPAPHLNMLYNPTYIKTTFCAVFSLTPHSFSCPFSPEHFALKISLVLHHKQGCLYRLCCPSSCCSQAQLPTPAEWLHIKGSEKTFLIYFFFLLFSYNKTRVSPEHRQERAAAEGSVCGCPGGKSQALCPRSAGKGGIPEERLFYSTCKQQQDMT